MKKNPVFFLLLLFIYPLNIEAQEVKDSIQTIVSPKHHIYGGYGFGTLPDWGNAFADAIGNINFNTSTFGPREGKSKNPTGCFYIGYNHSLTNNFAIDVKVSYQKYYDMKLYAGSEYDKIDDHYYAIMTGFRINYSNTGFTQLYSGLNLGLFIWDKKREYSGRKSESNINYLGYQITALGIRTGGMVGGFIELGIGYTGILSGGLSVQF